MPTSTRLIRLTRPGLDVGFYQCTETTEYEVAADGAEHVIRVTAVNAQGNATFTRQPDGSFLDDHDGVGLYTVMPA